MCKKLLLLILASSLVFILLGTGMAIEQGNERKGKYLFRKNCRSCHKDGGSAPALNPNSKTQAQWERAFDRFQRLECADEWEKLSAEEHTDILTYVYNHAFDSPSPATCE